jgi:hypothetical protein
MSSERDKATRANTPLEAADVDPEEARRFQHHLTLDGRWSDFLSRKPANLELDKVRLTYLKMGFKTGASDVLEMIELLRTYDLGPTEEGEPDWLTQFIAVLKDEAKEMEI